MLNEKQRIKLSEISERKSWGSKIDFAKNYVEDMYFLLNLVGDLENENCAFSLQISELRKMESIKDTEKMLMCISEIRNVLCRYGYEFSAPRA